jgi:hypothetical protein
MATSGHFYWPPVGTNYWPLTEEERMYQQDSTPVAPVNTATPSVQEFYLPLGGGTDPDFYLPADREHVPGRFSRWIHGLPGFGVQRSSRG